MSSWKYACLGFQLWTLVFLRHEKQGSRNDKKPITKKSLIQSDNLLKGLLYQFLSVS